MTGSSQISEYFVQHNLFSQAICTQRTPRDPSNRRLNEHGIYIRHCQEANFEEGNFLPQSAVEYSNTSALCFIFLTSNDVPLHQFLGTLCHCKLNIQDYCESLGNHEKPGQEETWSCLCLVTSHIIILSKHPQQLKPRLDKE